MSNRYAAGLIRPGYDPIKVPDAPVLGVVSPGNTSVTVAFTAPFSTGGGDITSYTAYATCNAGLASNASSPITVTGLTNNTAYTFRVIANNVYGPSAPSGISASATPGSQGQQAYTTAGTYSWVAPAGVTSVSVVAVGGGGAGYGKGGGGGELRYKNNITVVPGNTYAVVVGAGGTADSIVNGGVSTFNSTTVVAYGGGSSGGCTGFGNPGGSGGTGDGGGNGGASGSSSGGYAGGGGAGGYSGAGGAGANDGGGTASAGSGGGGGGGGNNGCAGNGGGGGGVGILGSGCNGAAGAVRTRGGGGSGGVGGTTTPTGGTYGGGAGAASSPGAIGAVRIIWPGNSRSFPSTNTEDL